MIVALIGLCKDLKMMRTRHLFGALALASLAALLFAYALEYIGGLMPCPLCIFQRVAMFALFVVSLVGWLHNPAVAGRAIYGGLAVLAGGAGAAIAARHVWLIHLPPDQVPACGPGLDYLVQVMPLSDVMATVLRGDASCATVKASFLGLSLPAWTLAVFGVLTLFAIVGLIRGPAPGR
tara:strand:+ start:7960 stop:8496 length:537 start_codon:yes stop_codon:yes gene_type:complete